MLIDKAYRSCGIVSCCPTFSSISLRFSLPLKIACLNKLQYNSIAAGESSLPGTGYVIKFGLQLESTIPMVGIAIFAASLTAECWIRTLFSVLKKMHRSGNRVTALNCTLALVKIPPLQNRVCEYSPHSIAVRSTRCAFCAFRLNISITPCRYAM